jgi:hypothetical protein
MPPKPCRSRSTARDFHGLEPTIDPARPPPQPHVGELYYRIRGAALGRSDRIGEDETMRNRLVAYLYAGQLASAAIGCGTDRHPELLAGTDAGLACRAPTPSDAAVAPIDAGAIPSADAAAVAPSGCDGDETIQFAFMEITNGNAIWEELFPSPRGSYVAVDGRCHYFAFNDNLIGVREGDLSEAQVDRLRADLQVERLNRFVSQPRTCYDGVLTMVATNTAAFGCGCAECTGDDLGTSLLHTAADRLARFSATGAALSGPVRAMALPYRDNGGCFRPHFVSWPLARPMAEVTDLVQDYIHPARTSALFEDADEIASLRDLRTRVAMQSLTVGMQAYDIYVDDGGVKYRLFLQDQLPADAAARIDPFLSQAFNTVDATQP